VRLYGVAWKFLNVAHLKSSAVFEENWLQTKSKKGAGHAKSQRDIKRNRRQLERRSGVTDTLFQMQI
jgi:hypothetical protein